jgi:indole-3-acetate monooxygenase
VLQGLFDASLFRLLLPRFLDGGEVDPLTFVEVIEEIAKHDGSTGWCLCQAAGCSMAAAYLRPEAAREIFADQRAVLAWGPSNDARAQVVDGGYRINGTWSFASGCRHATWLGGYCPIQEPDGKTRRRPDGAADGRTMLFPAAQATIVDVWHVTGLRGTASDAFTVTDLFVPHEHTSRATIRPSAGTRRRSTASPPAVCTRQASRAWRWASRAAASTLSWP